MQLRSSVWRSLLVLSGQQSQVTRELYMFSALRLIPVSLLSMESHKVHQIQTPLLPYLAHLAPSLNLKVSFLTVFTNQSVSFLLLILCYFALAGVLPKYFSSEWSVAQFHLQEGTHYTVAFGLQKNTVIILGMDGRYDLRK